MKYQFHNLDLSINQQAAIIEYAEQRDFAFSDVIQSVVELNIKVSFSWNNFHDCAQMSLTPKNKEHTFYGYIVTTNHVDIFTLGKILLWLLADGFDQIDPPTGSKSQYDW